jgi:hypothetical protein
MTEFFTRGESGEHHGKGKDKDKDKGKKKDKDA